MANFNKVILAGNLVRDPELRVTERGGSVCKFGMAVNRTYRDNAGNEQQEVTFVDVEAWGKPAEVIARYCGKGKGLMVEGRLKLDSWVSQGGEKKTRLKVVLEGFQFMGGGGKREDGADAVPAGVGDEDAGLPF
jgi:single-strand DNA-binding protein